MAVALGNRGKNFQEKEQQACLQQPDFNLHVSESEKQVLMMDVREGKEFKA